MLEPRRLQGELRAPLWNPRHTGYVTPNTVHAFAARAGTMPTDAALAARKASPLTTPALTQNWPRRGTQRSRLLPRSAGVERWTKCARGGPPHQGGPAQMLR